MDHQPSANLADDGGNHHRVIGGLLVKRENASDFESSGRRKTRVRAGEGHIRADNIAGCNRTPACGYPPKTLDEIYGKVLRQKAVIVDGEMDILPGIRIHPAHHAHTAGSQLLEVRTGTSVGTLVFGSDVYSSWQGIRDWMVSNIQSSTDSAQQFLAYEKCYKLTGKSTPDNCIAAHEPTSYTKDYPITSNSWSARSTPASFGTGEDVRSRAATRSTSAGDARKYRPRPRR